MQRRKFLNNCAAIGSTGVALGMGVLPPGIAFAEESDPFQATSVDAVLRALGVAGAEPSDDIKIVAPKVAENGAAVPVGIASSISETTEIMTIVAANPKPLAARSRFGKGAAASVDSRIKMGRTTELIAVVKAGGRYYMARTDVKVTVGGCGG